MFKRKFYDKLLNWKQESNGRYAVLVEGARRVGKTTLVKEFAKNEYKTYILIDFSSAPIEVVNLFDDLTDLNYIFMRLQLQYQVELIERNSVIVFDEVQFCPKARQAIKTLVADGRYDYIETGSLISIKKNVEKILIPSEEDKLTMYPMDYEEFCWALGDSVSVPTLKEFYLSGASLGEGINRRIMRYFRLYMLVGGMPQAVDEYIKTNNLHKVDVVKHKILKLYDDDFYKIDPSGKSSIYFNNIPAQLSKNVSRYQISSVSKNARAKDDLKLISEMSSSKTVLLSYHANDPNVGLSSNIDLTKFKMFLLDTGLFVTLMFKDKDITENIIYEKLLSNKLPANLGYLYENVVAQTLVANGYELFYHTWRNKSTQKNCEIDFLLSKDFKICPIEVKSSGYKTHSSLDIFCKKYSSRISKKYLIYTKDYTKENDTIYLPVYLAQFL